MEAKGETDAAPPPPSPTMAEKVAGEEKFVMKPPSPETRSDGGAAKANTFDKIINNPQPEKNTAQNSPQNTTAGSVDGSNRELALARVELEKKAALIKAWEDSQKAKLQNKAQKKMSSIATWENSKRASIEAEITKMEEAFEKKKAQGREKLLNKIASIHKAAEEKRAIIEARKGEDILKTEEAAAKFKAAGIVPKKVLICFDNYTS